MSARAVRRDPAAVQGGRSAPALRGSGRPRLVHLDEAAEPAEPTAAERAARKRRRKAQRKARRRNRR